MRKLSEYKNEEALDLLAELIEPAAEIMTDPAVVDAFGKGNKKTAVKTIIKNHKKSVVEVLAILEGVPVEEYECNVFTLPLKLFEILNDEELLKVFSLQGQNVQSNASGSVMENTEDENE